MNQAANNNNPLTAQEVAKYLKTNVDFFQQYPDLLLTMKFDDRPEGSISLVERQMKGLRHRNSEFEKKLQQVVVNAQENQQLLQQTISLAISLVPCENLATLVETLFLQLSTLFSIDHKNLLLDQSSFNTATGFSADMQALKITLADNFPKQKPVSGRLKNAEKTALFSDPAKVNSAAILPLGDNGELGLLVLGSEDPAHFDPEMGDLFLMVIADMLSIMLSRFNS